MPFTTLRLSDRISLIQETGVANFMRCNIWHVRGRDCDLVIDTGMGLGPLKDWVLNDSNRPLRRSAPIAISTIWAACMNSTAALATGPRRISLPTRRPVRPSILAIGQGLKS